MRHSESESRINMLSTARTSDERLRSSLDPEKDRVDDILSRMRIPAVESERLFGSSGRLSESPEKLSNLQGKPAMAHSESEKMLNVGSDRLLHMASPRGTYAAESLGKSRTLERERDSAGLSSRLSLQGSRLFNTQSPSSRYNSPLQKGSGRRPEKEPDSAGLGTRLSTDQSESLLNTPSSERWRKEYSPRQKDTERDVVGKQ